MFTQGLGFSWIGNEKHLKLFHDDFRVIRSSGATRVVSDDVEWHTFQSGNADLAGLLNALNLEKAINSGESSGGVQALMFAYTYPEIVSALIVDGTSAEINFIAARNGRTFAERILMIGKMHPRT